MSCLTNHNHNINSSFGLDYFDIVNNQIKNILYPKPEYDKKLLRNLKKYERTKLFYIKNQYLGLKINICEIKPKSTEYDKIIIFSHGNGCDIYTFYPYLKSLADNLNALVVSYDYPTYGLSQGELNEFTCYESLQMVITHYLNNTDKILLIGQSLGTGIVVDYISKNQWTNPVILISPYKSIPKVITDLDIVECLVSKNKFASYLKIFHAQCPIKIFHGKSDKTIESSHSIELYNLISNKKFKPTFFNNVGHNDILTYIDFNEYNEILQLL